MKRNFKIHNMKTQTKSVPAGAPISYEHEIRAIRTSTGVPVLVGATEFTKSALKEIAIFGMVAGKPVSSGAIDALNEVPEKRYFIQKVLQAMRDHTNMTVVVTSHDCSRTGKKRVNSEGHLDGSATDVSFCIPSGEEGETLAPLVDILNSLSFLSFLKDVATAAFPASVDVARMHWTKPTILGVEYDHVHIEWPWSQRLLPNSPGFISIREVPAGFAIGSFYNPQTVYGLPQSRSGHEFQKLFHF